MSCAWYGSEKSMPFGRTLSGILLTKRRQRLTKSTTQKSNAHNQRYSYFGCFVSINPLSPKKILASLTLVLVTMLTSCRCYLLCFFFSTSQHHNKDLDCQLFFLRLLSHFSNRISESVIGEEVFLLSIIIKKQLF